MEAIRRVHTRTGGVDVFFVDGCFSCVSSAEAFKRFGKNLKIEVENGKETISYELAIPGSFKNSRTFKTATGNIPDPRISLNYKIRSQLALDETCAVCGSS